MCCAKPRPPRLHRDIGGVLREHKGRRSVGLQRCRSAGLQRWRSSVFSKWVSVSLLVESSRAPRHAFRGCGRCIAWVCGGSALAAVPSCFTLSVSSSAFTGRFCVRTFWGFPATECGERGAIVRAAEHAARGAAGHVRAAEPMTLRTSQWSRFCACHSLPCLSHPVVVIMDRLRRARRWGAAAAHPGRGPAGHVPAAHQRPGGAAAGRAAGPVVRHRGPPRRRCTSPWSLIYASLVLCQLMHEALPTQVQKSGASNVLALISAR